MKHRSLIGVFLVVTAGVSPLAVGSENVDAKVISIGIGDLANYLRAGNELLRAAEMDVQAAKIREAQSGYAYLPEIEAFGGLETRQPSPVTSQSNLVYGIEASVPLYDGGSFQAMDQKAALTTAKRQAEQALLFADTLATAQDIYWRIVFHKEMNEILKASLKRNNEVLRAAKRRIQSGLATSTDLIEFEMQESNLKRDLEENRIQIANLTRELNQLLGFEQERSLDVKDKLSHDHNWQLKFAITTADTEFVLKSDDLAIAEMEAEIDAENKKSRPKIDAFVDWQATRDRDATRRNAQEYESSIGIRLTLDLRDRFTNNRETQAVLKDAQALRIRREFKQKSLQTEFANETNTLAFIHGQLHQAEEAVKRAERYYQLTQSEYVRGVKNSLDMLSAANNLYETRHRLSGLIRDFQLTKTRMMARKSQN